MALAWALLGALFCVVLGKALPHLTQSAPPGWWAWKLGPWVAAVPQTWPLTLVFIVFWQTWAEEVFWRGLIFSALLGVLQPHQPTQKPFLVWIHGAVFALGHTLLYGAQGHFLSSVTLMYLFWFALIGNWIYLARQSLFLPFVFHFAWNLWLWNAHSQLQPLKSDPLGAWVALEGLYFDRIHRDPLIGWFLAFTVIGLHSAHHSKKSKNLL